MKAAIRNIEAVKVALALTRATSIPVSSSLARHVGNYEEALVRFQTHEGDGDARLDVAASSTVDMFLTCTSDALTRASHVSRQFAEFQRTWRSKLSVRRGSLMDRVLTHLPEHPVMDTKLLAKTCGVTQRQAALVVDQLVNANIVVHRNIVVNRNIDGMRRGYEVIDVLKEVDTSARHPSGADAVPLSEGTHISDAIVYSDARASDTEDQTPIRHAHRRDACGAHMPIAKTTCVLVRGHSGPHRSSRPWHTQIA